MICLQSLYHNKTSCFELIKFIEENSKVKHTHITTISEIIKKKVYTKAIEMPSRKAWV
jgi:hypothetical protein